MESGLAIKKRKKRRRAPSSPDDRHREAALPSSRRKERHQLVRQCFSRGSGRKSVSGLRAQEKAVSNPARLLFAFFILLLAFTLVVTFLLIGAGDRENGGGLKFDWPWPSYPEAKATRGSRSEQVPASMRATSNGPLSQRFERQTNASSETRAYPGIMPQTTEGWFNMPQN